MLLVAIFAPLLAPHDPNRASAPDVLASPSSEHWLGADGSGHDILSRLLVATRSSVAAALVALVVAAVIGITAGPGRRLLRPQVVGHVLLAGQRADGAARASWCCWRPARCSARRSGWIMVIFGILVAPAFYRVVYGAVTGVRHELYVDAARVFGLSDARIIGRHILSVVRAPAIILAAGVAGIAIAVQAGLDFLGLGDLSKPSWGGMLNDAFANIYTKPINLLWPSLAIGLTCIALALFGNALRDELERSAAAPKRRRASAPRRGRPGRGRGVSRSSCTTSCPARPSGEELLARQRPVGRLRPAGRLGEDRRPRRVPDRAARRGARPDRRVRLGQDPDGVRRHAAAAARRPDHRRRRSSSRAVDLAVGLREGDDQAARAARSPTSRRSRCPTSTRRSPSAASSPSRCGSRSGSARPRPSEQALDLLARVGIPDPERTFAAYPHQISGGMAQRVLIAGAVSCDPDLLIADEPTTALDVTVQAEVLDLLRDLQEEFHMGVLLVTHNFGVVADLCDRVSVMRDGRIVETGPARADLRRPAARVHPSRCSTRSSRTASLAAPSTASAAACGALTPASPTKEPPR